MQRLLQKEIKGLKVKVMSYILINEKVLPIISDFEDRDFDDQFENENSGTTNFFQKKKGRPHSMLNFWLMTLSKPNQCLLRNHNNLSNILYPLSCQRLPTAVLCLSLSGSLFRADWDTRALRNAKSGPSPYSGGHWRSRFSNHADFANLCNQLNILN